MVDLRGDVVVSAAGRRYPEGLLNEGTKKPRDGTEIPREASAGDDEHCNLSFAQDDRLEGL